MKRRETLKLAGLGIMWAALPPLAKANEIPKKFPKSTGRSVVIVGGGFGGLSMAKTLRQLGKDIDVTVIEKNNLFLSCPFSNTLLGGLEGMHLEKLLGDCLTPAQKYHYRLIHAEVTEIDRDAKIVTTTEGIFAYDILVLSPGIAYDYKRQFPTWSDEKIRDISQSCPAALLPNSEHITLQQQLHGMKEGNVYIIPPARGKYRCPPAPYERASMVAHWMKTQGIKGKVIILDTRGSAFVKSKAFQEAWQDLYPEIVEYHGYSEIVDIDSYQKRIVYKVFTDEEDTLGKLQKDTYAVCNLMPINKCSPVIEMADLKRDEAGFALMEGYSFRSKSDVDVYVVGDAVTHAIPASAHSAIWSAKRAATQIIDQLDRRVNDPRIGLPQKAANVCFSMVGGEPEEAIMVSHTFKEGENGRLQSIGTVQKPKDGKGKYRSQGMAKAAREWFDHLMEELFT